MGVHAAPQIRPQKGPLQPLSPPLPAAVRATPLPSQVMVRKERVLVGRPDQSFAARSGEAD